MLDTSTTKLAASLAPYAVELRHEIHKFPELALKEYNTTKLIKRELDKLGVEYQDLELDTGYVAIIRGQKPGDGKTLAIRADIDALPMDDLCGKPWVSQIPGVAHTCGHDAHTACLIAAAKALMCIRDRFSGIVKLIFQPGEEGMLGARILVKKGVMENPHVDCMVGMHCTPAYKLHTFAVAPGQVMAESDRFTITFHGKSAHASRPVEGSNAIVAAAHAIVALQGIASNEVTTKEQIVVNTCVADSGTAVNIIPDVAVIKGTVRTLTAQAQTTAEEAIKRIADSSARICGCTAGLEYFHGCPPVSNHPQLTGQIKNTLAKVAGEENVVHLKTLLGGEDFSLYTMEMNNTVFYRLGCGVPGKDSEPALHNAHFDFNDDAMVYGIAGHIQFVLDQNG